MLQLLLQGLTSGVVQCSAMVACLSQQAVAHLAQAAATHQPQLLPAVLQTLLLALVATVNSIAAEPSSVDLHVRVWQHAQDALQVQGRLPACCIVVRRAAVKVHADT